ncbi:MAG TPA: SGNH/GDSL hydrolase family protein [Pyrinomonadaceae bacterium]
MRLAKSGRAFLGLTLACFVTFLLAPPAYAEGGAGGDGRRGEASRFEQLVEANVIATHAFQILLAKKSGKGDAACYAQGGLSDVELETLVKHQSSLLKSKAGDVLAWARGGRSGFDSSKDLEPILKSGLAVPPGSPANVFTDYLRAHTRSGADVARLRSVASLYQTILEVERDGDLLQDQFAFYIALGLPVYVGQLSLPGGDDAMLAVGRKLERRACASPYAADAAAWQIAGRKVWDWGEKHLHIRDDKVLAAELLRERDVRAVVPRVRAVPAQKIAVVGHSFTMGQHWSSPSSFVPVVTEIFRRVNPKVEFKQFERGGLTASRARQRFYQGVLDWKPDKVLLVVMTRTDEDYAALKEMGAGFKAAGVEAFMFDDIHDPESVSKPGTSARAARVAREVGIKVIEVGALLAAAPDRGRFLSLDRVHMTEPYHRLMAKEWLKFLAGVRGERLAGRAE